MPDDAPDAESLFVYGGRSMWPAFQDGDVLEVRPVPARGLRPGDCIVYRHAGSSAPVVHRVVRTQPVIVTQGDAHPDPDDSGVEPSSVIGVVRSRRRWRRAKRMSGGPTGVIGSRLLRALARLDPSSDSRGGRAARGIRRCLRPVALRLVDRIAVEPSADVGRPGAYWVLMRRWPAGTSESEDARPEPYWAWSLVFSSNDLARRRPRCAPGGP